MSNIEMGLLWFALGTGLAMVSKPTFFGLTTILLLYALGTAAVLGARL